VRYDQNKLLEPVHILLKKDIFGLLIEIEQHVIFDLAVFTFTGPETLIFWPQIQTNKK